MANYAFTVDSHFSPFSMQEMLVPLTAYKDAFEKTEETYDDLSKRSDTFKYLSETLPEDSKARKLYEGYANDLSKQAEDLAHNGLTMSNRRALTSLKRRYQGEIGRIVQADEAMREEKKLRQSLNAQDSSRLYATDNLNIDDFLDGNNPNLYSISGNELYTRGAAAGKAASTRVFSAGDAGSTLGGYYRDYVQKWGYNSDTLAKFRQDMASIPELQMAADAILEERGVNQNLTGYNLQRARQSVINGMIDGAIYQENHTPQRDLGVLDAATQQQLDLQKRGQNISLASQGLTYDDKTGTVTYDSNKDPSLQKANSIAKIKASAGNGTNRNTSAYNAKNKGTVMVGAKTGALYKGDDDDDTKEGTAISLKNARALNSEEYSELVDGYGNITNDYVRNTIGDGKISDYRISIIPSGASKSGWFSGDTDENVYVIEPRDSKRATQESENISDSNSSEGANDIPYTE